MAELCDSKCGGTVVEGRDIKRSGTVQQWPGDVIVNVVEQWNCGRAV